MSMILSAMIFAGVTMVVGVILGFLLGQARSRMTYEEELRHAWEERDALKAQLAQLRDTPLVKSQEPPSAAGPAGGTAES